MVANSGIVCGVILGEFSFAGAGALVNKDVKTYALMVGVPARQVGWMSEFGERVALPLEGEGEYTCPHSDTVYLLRGTTLRTRDA